MTSAWLTHDYTTSERPSYFYSLIRITFSSYTVQTFTLMFIYCKSAIELTVTKKYTLTYIFFVMCCWLKNVCSLHFSVRARFIPKRDMFGLYLPYRSLYILNTKMSFSGYCNQAFHRVNKMFGLQIFSVGNFIIAQSPI